MSEGAKDDCGDGVRAWVARGDRAMEAGDAAEAQACYRAALKRQLRAQVTGTLYDLLEPGRRLIRALPREAAERTEVARHLGVLRRRALDAWAAEAAEAAPEAWRVPRVVGRAAPSAASPAGALVVWSPRGSGRLTEGYAIAPTYTPAERRGALPRTRRALVWDQTPLVELQAKDCPTCDTLMRCGGRSAEQAARCARALGTLEVSALRDDLSVALEALGPLLEALEPGMYAVALLDVVPSDGDGACFWDAFAPWHETPAARGIFAPNVGPRFMVPTQPPSAFRAESWARAEQAWARHPALALHLRHQTVALLDGHHRALRAWERGARCPCVVLAPMRPWLTAKRWPAPPDDPGQAWGRHVFSGAPMPEAALEFESALMDATLSASEAPPQVVRWAARLAAERPRGRWFPYTASIPSAASVERALPEGWPELPTRSASLPTWRDVPRHEPPER